MMSRPSSLARVCAGASALASCQEGSRFTSSPTPTPTPTPTPPPTGATLNVEPCLTQMVRPGVTVAILFIPDTLKLDFSQPSLFPNGRALPDPVIDYTLAALFLDLTVHPITTLHRIPLGPPANDRPFRSPFPSLPPPQGHPPPAQGLARPFDSPTHPAP